MQKIKKLYFINIMFAILIAISDALYITLKRPEYVLKTITSSLFLILGILNFILLYKDFKSKSIKLYGLFNMLALLFCFLGDVLLIDFFIVGAVFFALGHLLFIIAFSFLNKFNLKDIIAGLILFAICLCVILIVPVFEFNGMLPVILTYAFIISFMLGKSFTNFIFNTKYTNTFLALISFGALLFFLSDLMLLFNVFSDVSTGNACLSLYYPAQFVLAYSILFMNQSEISSVKKMSFIRKCYCRIFQTCFKILLPILPYREPKLLKDYEEMCKMFKDKNISSAILITGKDIIDLKLADDLISICKKQSIELIIFDEVLPNPTIEIVEKARQKYLSNNCNAIIALGGGSAIDCAKAMGARIVKPKKSLQKMKGLLKIRKHLPTFVAIPTTAGTGSETTLASVITNEKSHLKFTINDFSLIPHYAILDYKITLNLPKSLTSTTGMDALTHAIEAYIGNSTTKYTRRMSEEATKLIVENLYSCYENGKLEEARKNMLLASFKAGNAFTRSYVGYVHAIAHSLGGQYHVAHGLANAKILPVMLKEYGSKIYKKLAKLAKISDVANDEDTNKVATEKMIDFIENLNNKMGIEPGFAEIKNEDISLMADNAEKEANPLYPVPKLYSKEELEEIYKKLKK